MKDAIWCQFGVTKFALCPSGQALLIQSSFLTPVRVSAVIWAGRWVLWRIWGSTQVSNHWLTFIADRDYVIVQFFIVHSYCHFVCYTKMAIIEYLISLSTQLLSFSLFTRIEIAIIDWQTYYCGSLIYLYEILSNAIIAIHWIIFIEQLLLGIHLLLLTIVVLWLLDLLLSFNKTIYSSNIS